MKNNKSIEQVDPFQQWNNYFAVFHDFNKTGNKFDLPNFINEQAIELAHKLDWFDDDAHYEFLLQTFWKDASEVDDYSDKQKGLIKKIIFFEVKPHWLAASKDPQLKTVLNYLDKKSTIQAAGPVFKNEEEIAAENELVDVNSSFSQTQKTSNLKKPLKVYISQFYYVRYFPEHIYPVSTCMWDPKWFNDFKGQGHLFVDKRNVVCGLRAEFLPLSQEYWKKLEEKNTQCRKDCPYKTQLPCEFMKVYSEYLHSLDFKDVINKLTVLASKGKELNKCKKEPAVCLMVAEAATCPCAERPPLIEWFKENGVELIEITKENVDKI